MWRQRIIYPNDVWHEMYTKEYSSNIPITLWNSVLSCVGCLIAWKFGTCERCRTCEMGKEVERPDPCGGDCRPNDATYPWVAPKTSAGAPQITYGAIDLTAPNPSSVYPHKSAGFAAKMACKAAAAACAVAQRFQATVAAWADNAQCPDLDASTSHQNDLIHEEILVDDEAIHPVWSTKTRQAWYMARHRHIWNQQKQWSPPSPDYVD